MQKLMDTPRLIFAEEKTNAVTSRLPSLLEQKAEKNQSALILQTAISYRVVLRAIYSRKWNLTPN